jgi:hypothetical protein
MHRGDWITEYGFASLVDLVALEGQNWIAEYALASLEGLSILYR